MDDLASISSKFAKMLQAAATSPSFSVTITLGQIMHDTFVPGVSQMQFHRILNKLKSHRGWDNSSTSTTTASCCFQPPPSCCIVGKRQQQQQQSAMIAAQPFDLLLLSTNKKKQTTPPSCTATATTTTFEHKCWRFVLCKLPSAWSGDRDDDRALTYQVQLQLIHPNNAPCRYLAEAGLLLAQDLCKMCKQQQQQQ